jgi:hypothetical protein
LNHRANDELRRELGASTYRISRQLPKRENEWAGDQKIKAFARVYRFYTCTFALSNTDETDQILKPKPYPEKLKNVLKTKPYPEKLP